VLVGVLSDQLFPGPQGVRYALATVLGLSCPLMIALLWLSRAPYRRLVAPSDPIADVRTSI
jgi:hypothetical protein